MGKGPYRTTLDPQKDFVDRLLGKNLAYKWGWSHKVTVPTSSITGHSTAPPTSNYAGGPGMFDPRVKITATPPIPAGAPPEQGPTLPNSYIQGGQVLHMNPTGHSGSDVAGAGEQNTPAIIGLGPGGQPIYASAGSGGVGAIDNAGADLQAITGSAGANTGVGGLPNSLGGTGDPQVDGAVNTGFAGTLAPGALNEILADPDQFLYEYLKYMGMDPTDATMSRFGNMPDVVQVISSVANPNLDLSDTTDDTTAALLNYMGNYINEQSRVGGKTPVASELLHNIISAGGTVPGSDANGGAGNALSELLAGGSDSDQIKQYTSYVAAALNSLSPMAQNAAIARLNRWGREWMSIKNKNMQDNTTFGEYVASKGGLFGGS